MAAKERKSRDTPAAESGPSTMPPRLILLALDHCGVPVFVVSSDARLVYINDAACSRLEYSREELLSMRVHDIDPRFPAENWGEFWKGLRRDGRRCFESLHRTKSGGVFPVEISAAFFTDQRKEYVCAFVRNLAERKRMERVLRYRLEFEELICRLSTEFINLPLNEIDRGINQSLKEIGCLMGADRSYVFRLWEEEAALDNTHEWCAEGIEPQIDNLQGLPVEACPWWMEKLRRLETIHIPRIADLPARATAERELLQAQQIQSLVAVPMTCGGVLIGFVGFDAVRAEKTWSDDSIALLRVAGELFASVLERQRVEEALWESQQTLKNTLASMDDMLFVLDENGVFVDYPQQSPEKELLLPPERFLGKPFQQVLPPDVSGQLEAAVTAIRATGISQRFDYSLEVSGQTAWFSALISPRKSKDGGFQGVVVATRNITDRKRAEQALQKEEGLLRRLLDFQERERRLVAYEIHDELAQQLTGALMQFQAFDQLRDRHPERAHQSYVAATRLLEAGLAEARRLIGGLRPPVLDEFGIVAAIEYLISERHDSGEPRIEFQHHGRLQRLASPLQAALFRIVQESLTNASQHSRSEKVRVELAVEGDRVRVEVRDWGVGFDSQNVEEDRFGLQGIRERAHLFGGQATIETAPGQGTRVCVELPLLENRPEEGPSGQ